MDIYLSFGNLKETLRLPVLPSEFKVSTGLNNKTVEVIGLGEIGIIGNRKLKEISFESFFPKHYSPLCQYLKIPDPYTAVQQIETWRDSGNPVRLNILGTPIIMACMIESFEHGQKGGEPDDVYYSLKLKEYRFIEIRTITDKNGKLATAKKRPNEKALPKTYTVKSGDSLPIIVRKIYGGALALNDFYEKNKQVIGSDPDQLKPGQVLIV